MSKRKEEKKKIIILSSSFKLKQIDPNLSLILTRLTAATLRLIFSA